MKIKKKTNGDVVITLSMVQRRIATGLDQSARSEYVLTRNRWGHLLLGHRDEGDTDILAIVKVTHPAVMAGTWQDFRADVRAVVIAGLIDAGYIIDPPDDMPYISTTGRAMFGLLRAGQPTLMR